MKLTLILISIAVFITFILTLVAFFKARRAIRILKESKLVEYRTYISYSEPLTEENIYPVKDICGHHFKRIELIEDHLNVEFIEEHTCGPQLRAKENSDE